MGKSIITVICVLFSISGIYLMSIGATPVIALTPLISCSIVYILLKRTETNRRIGAVEKQIPDAIMKIASYLDSGMDFIEVLTRISKSGTAIGKIFNQVMREINSGVSVPIALEDSKRDIKSKDYSLFINRLIMIYRFGGSSEPLRRLAGEMLERRKIEIKKFSGKSLMYSLMLVSGSSVFPAMFLAYLIVGSAFMEIKISPLDALLIPVLVFPSIDALIIAFIESKRPRFT